MARPSPSQPPPGPAAVAALLASGKWNNGQEIGYASGLGVRPYEEIYPEGAVTADHLPWRRAADRRPWAPRSR